MKTENFLAMRPCAKREDKIIFAFAYMRPNIAILSVKRNLKTMENIKWFNSLFELFDTTLQCMIRMHNVPENLQFIIRFPDYPKVFQEITCSSGSKTVNI